MKVLVYGWYHQGNIGDDLFIDAFRYLFPNLELVFTESIKKNDLKDIEVIFFGGGSFLFGDPKISTEALALIKQKKIFYIGVGIEDVIHPTHLDLMSRAKLLAIRTDSQLKRVMEINPNTMLIPDLVYSLRQPEFSITPYEKSVLIFPNVAVVPHNSDPNWKHAAWGYFKSEFCQFLDYLVENEYHPHIFPMCTAHKEDDRWAAFDLVSFMKHRSNGFVINFPIHGIQEITRIVSQHSVVITQRFHGIVLSELCNVPYVSIHHHDKLKKSSNNGGQFLSYYGLSKQNLIDAVDRSLMQNNKPFLPIETNIFETLVGEVTSLL